MRLPLPLLALLGACSVTGDARPPQTAPAELPPISPNRPTFSDGTSLVPLGHAQVETGYTFTKRNRGGIETGRHNAPEVLGRYRVLEGLEARVLWSGYAWTETQAGGTTVRDDGGTDVGLGVVVPVCGQDGWRPALAVEGITTVGTGAHDFSTRHADPTFKLLWSYGGGHLPDWFAVGGNLIAGFPTDQGDRFTQAAASVWTTASLNDSGDTCVFGEWYVVSPYANNTESARSADFGIVQRLSRRIAVDARVGFGLSDEADDFFAGVGFSVLF